VVAGGVGATTATSSTGIPHCSFIRNFTGERAVERLSGRRLTPRFCRAVGRGFHGRPFYGRFGQRQCLFLQRATGIRWSVWSRDPLLGAAACRGLKKAAGNELVRLKP
jgi:hypothetical protein